MGNNRLLPFWGKQRVLLTHNSCHDVSGWFVTLNVHTLFIATAGSAAEGKVRDFEEPGSVLFYLCRCYGIQGRKTH